MSLQKFPSFFLNSSEDDMTGEIGNSYHFGKFTLDLSEHRLSDAGAPVSLTPKAFEILKVLVERAGHLVEKDELMNRVWPDSFVEEVNVARIIHTLRKTLGDDGNGNKLIETVPKKGYRFVAEVVIEPAGERANSEAHGLSEFSDQGDPNQDEPLSAWSWKHYASAAAICVAIVMSALVAYRYFSQPTVSSGVNRRSIAVLPFVNSTGDAGQDELADGLTENIINNLSDISSLRVIGRDSVFRFRGQDIQSADVARELGADSLIKGDIKQVGNELIINVNLIDPKDGSQLWGNQFTKNSFDLVAVPNGITQAVVQRLDLKLTPTENDRLSVLPTENGEAYKLYLQGRKLGQEGTSDALKKAIALDQKAIEKDPGFGLAYADMGMRYVNLGIYFEPPDETMPKARESAQTALALDPALHDPHIVLGLVALIYDWNWDRAGDELIEATSVNLRAIEAFSCTAHVLQMEGKTSDADEALRHALKDDPLSKSLTTELGCNSYYARRYDESIKEYRESLTADPANFLAAFGLARTLNQQGKYKEAVDELNSLSSIMPEVPEIVVAERAFANGKMGNREAAEKDLNMLEERSRQKYVDPFLNAVVYLGMNDKEKSLNSLDKAIAVRSSLLPSLVNDAKWDPIREDSHFQSIIQKIGFKRG